MASTEPPIADEDPSTALTVDFRQTADVLVAAGGADDTLALVVQLAVDTIEGCDLAGIFLVEGGAVTTPVCTDPLVAELDAVQNDTGEGPGREAVGRQVVCYVGDLEGDPGGPGSGHRQRREASEACWPCR